MSLQTDLDAFKAAWVTKAGIDTATSIANDIETLRGSGILDRAARAGDALPTLSLPDAHGVAIDLAALAATAPLVVVFYRGGWCPYCNLELRAYQQALPAITAAGARLVAVSPEAPDHTAATAEKNALGFPVLSDVEGRLAEALGIRFAMTPEIVALYRKFGHDLPARHGDGRWTLPIPATFVVARGGRIAQAFVDPDYRVRLDPADALQALTRLGVGAAA